MTATSHPDLPALRAALDAARVVFGAYDRTPVPECWRAAQSLLQQVLRRPELTGQALVGEARRLQVVSLPDAHALVALSALADRSTGPASTEAERIQLREAWMALQHAVPPEVFEPVAAPSPYAPPTYAPPSAPAGTPGAGTPPRLDPPRLDPPRADTSAGRSPNAWSPPPGVTASAASAADTADIVAPPRARRAWWPVALVGVLVLASIGTAIWWFTAGRTERLYQDGVAAYTRGAREVARDAFVELAQKQPTDARPLVYLGRMSREDGDLARARRFLTAAVRVAPSSAVAQRELASAMLADGQPELARRFYVHALELDPADRVAQGFLGCALYRLQRYDEAQRWGTRAGAGDWQRCIGPMPAAPSALPPAPIR
jgi:tetratricopeptide (TPR) repeat protein